MLITYFPKAFMFLGRLKHITVPPFGRPPTSVHKGPRLGGAIQAREPEKPEDPSRPWPSAHGHPNLTRLVATNLGGCCAPLRFQRNCRISGTGSRKSPGGSGGRNPKSKIGQVDLGGRSPRRSLPNILFRDLLTVMAVGNRLGGLENLIGPRRKRLRGLGLFTHARCGSGCPVPS